MTFPRITTIALACMLTVAAALSSTTARAQAPLTLPQSLAAAAQASPSLAIATQTLAQVRARAAQALAGGRLQISFNTTAGINSADVFQGPPDHETFGSIQNTLTVPLPLGPRARLAALQAQAQVEAAVAQADAARLTLANQVSAAYYDNLRRQSLLNAAGETLAQAQRDYDDAVKRSAAGDAPALDSLRARGPLATAKAGQYAAQSALATARETFNSLLGRDLDTPLFVAEAAPNASALPVTLAQARSLVLTRSADIRAADALVSAAQAALALSRQTRAPEYVLQASDTRSRDKTGFGRLDTLQASVTVPLSDGGLARAQVQEAQSALLGAKLGARSARLTAQLSVSSAYAVADASRHQAEAAQFAVTVAQETYLKTRQGYEQGLFPFTDVLNAQAALAQARAANAQAVYDAAVSRSALEYAIAPRGTL